MSALRAPSRGYTLIEVMVSLGVLAIGATGILALQKATLINNTNARNISVANSIAMTWAERLRADALQWNDPGGVPDIQSDTDWLQALPAQPYPTKFAPPVLIGMGAPGANTVGTDLYDGTDPRAFCTQLRFRQFTDTTGAPLWTNLVRVEIRVFWQRNGTPADCATDPALVDAQPGRYGAVYLTTSVLRNTSPN